MYRTITRRNLLPRFDLCFAFVSYATLLMTSVHGHAQWSLTTSIKSQTQVIDNYQEDPRQVTVSITSPITGLSFQSRMNASASGDANSGSVAASYFGQYNELKTPTYESFSHLYYVYSQSNTSVATGSTVYYYLLGTGFASVNDMNLPSGTVVNQLRHRSGSFPSTGQIRLVATLGSSNLSSGITYRPRNVGVVDGSYRNFATAQVSLKGPIGSVNSPLNQRPVWLPQPTGSPNRPNTTGGGTRALMLQTDGSLIANDLFWTSSNPADLFPVSNSAARLLSSSQETRELVYDITGPHVTHLLFDSAVANIVPNVVLEIAGLEVPVTLGQEIDLTQYDPLGLNHFNLHISGIDDWSALPDDWFLTGYKFASAGNVEVLTRAVPEVATWALLSIGFGVLGLRQATRSKRSNK